MVTPSERPAAEESKSERDALRRGGTGAEPGGSRSPSGAQEPSKSRAIGDAMAADPPGDQRLKNEEESVNVSTTSDGRRDSRRRRDIPDLWMRCQSCSKLIYKPKVEEIQHVCPECNFHFEIPSHRRIEAILDEGSFEEYFDDIAPKDPLGFVAVKAYADRLAAAQKRTGLKDGCVVGTGRLDGFPVVFGVSDSRFLRGSMGSVVGEKIFRGIELARDRGEPFIFVSGSGGGARMDEGIFSLMQMAKTSAALSELDRAGGLFVSILTNPTMGGAMASFAALGDIILAEPRALIGFAGPNVIRQTIRSEIPEGFQTSEFLLEHGFVDRIVNRQDLRPTLREILSLLIGGNDPDPGKAS